jgi:hypothetical protein
MNKKILCKKILLKGLFFFLDILHELYQVTVYVGVYMHIIISGPLNLTSALEA